QTQLLPRVRINQSTPGTLTGVLNGYRVVVTRKFKRQFETSIDGSPWARVPMSFAETELSCSVNRKTNGQNSETVSQAIYRELANKYNSSDESVSFTPLLSQEESR
ncbi:MAG: hypothetical protein O2854_04060, partial [Chloroflexi bacterium]|nr:hypothetical protein [Chloroflexota bacterium]